MAGNDGTLNFDTKIDSSGFQKGLDGIGGAVQKGLSITSKVLGGAATAVTALGGAAIKVGSDFETSFIKASTLFGDVAVDTDNLNVKILELSSVSGTAATELNETLYQAMSAGIPVTENMEDALRAVDTANKLSIGGYTSASTAMGALTTAINAYKLPASDAVKISDQLVTVQNKGVTTVDELASNMGKAIATGSAYGINLENINAGYIALTKSGISTAESTTYMSSMFNELGKSGSTVGEIIRQKTGMSFAELMTSGGTLADAMDVLAESVDGDSSALINLFGSAEAGKAANAIMQQGTDSFRQSLDDLAKSAGSTQAAYNAMIDTFGGQLGILQETATNLLTSMYETMQDTAKDVVKEAQGMVQQLQDAFNEGGFQGLVGAFGGVLAQIVQRIAEAAPMVIEAAVSLVMSFCDGLKSAPGIGESGASLITSLVTGLMSCVGEIWTTAIVLIGKLAEGIAAGAPQMVQAASTAITDIVECIVDWMPDILQAGADIIVALAEGIAGALPTLIYQAAVIVSDIALALVENLPALVDAALQLVMGLVQGLVDGIPVLLEGAVQLFMAILDALPVIIEKLLQALPDLITTIIDFFTQNIPLIIDGAIQLLMGIIDAIPTIIQAIVNNLPQIITALVNGLVGALPQLLEAAITLLMAIIEAIPDIVVAIAENLPQIITAIATGLAQAIPQIFTAAKDLLWQIIEAVPEIVVGIAGAVPDIIAGIVNGLIGGISAVWDAACELGSGILDGIKSFFGINSPSTVMAEQGDYLVQGLVNGIASMPAELAAYLDQTVQKIIAWGQQMFSNVQNIIQNVVNTTVNLIAQLPGKIWTWLVNVVTKTVQWGQQMLTTATNAIQNMISAIVSLISELPGKVWTWLVNTVTKVTQWGQQMLSAAKTAISNMISSVVSLMSELPGKVWTWLVNTVTKVTAWGQQMLSSAKTAITNMISSIVSLMSELPGKVATHLSNVVSKVVAWGSELASKGAAAAKGLFDAVVNGVSGLPSKMAEVGSNIVSGIWNGISSGWNWLKDKVSSLANSLLDAAKDALGINSPSKAFRDEFGRWLMPGTVEGVKQSMPKALREMEVQAGELLAAMQGTVDASMNEVSLNASSFGDAKALNNGGTTVYNDNHQEQENNYHVPVATPAETAKAQREAFRKMAGGVK